MAKKTKKNDEWVNYIIVVAMGVLIVATVMLLLRGLGLIWRMKVTRKTVAFMDFTVILAGVFWMIFRFIVGMDKLELVYSVIYIGFVILALLFNLSVIYGEKE